MESDCIMIAGSLRQDLAIVYATTVAFLCDRPADVCILLSVNTSLRRSVAHIGHRRQYRHAVMFAPLEQCKTTVSGSDPWYCAVLLVAVRRTTIRRASRPPS